MLAAFCRHVLDVARSGVVPSKIRRVLTFALCRCLLPFAALWCTQRARTGQRSNSSPRRSPDDTPMPRENSVSHTGMALTFRLPHRSRVVLAVCVYAECGTREYLPARVGRIRRACRVPCGASRGARGRTSDQPPDRRPTVGNRLPDRLRYRSDWAKPQVRTVYVLMLIKSASAARVKRYVATA